MPPESTDLTLPSSPVVPVLPLRDVVVYPHMVIPLFVGRAKSIKALEAAMAGNKQVLLAAQKSAALDEPQIQDIYEIGTLSSILQLLKLPDGTVRVLVEGSERARVLHFLGNEDYFTAQVATFPSQPLRPRYWRAHCSISLINTSSLTRRCHRKFCHRSRVLMTPAAWLIPWPRT